VENVNVTLRRSIAVAAVLLAPLLSSCGFDEPTDLVYNPGVGVNDRSGSVDVLHALIVSGSDGSGTVVAGLANNDQAQGDSLTRIAGSGEDSDVSVTLDKPIEIKPEGFVQLADEGPIAAEGEAIKPGTFVELTFSFEQGQNVTVQVPVVSHSGDFADVPLPSSASSSASASPSRSKTPSESASPSESPSS
jgi:hypothetical protein